MIISRRNKRSLPRFNLNYSGKVNSKSKDPIGINLIYRYKKDDQSKPVLLKYATGLKIRSKNWDQKLYRAKTGVHLPVADADSINEQLRTILDSCKIIILASPDITVKDFKQELDYILGYKARPRSKEETSLLEFIESFIDRSTLDARTILKFTTTQNHLMKYQIELGKEIRFDMINPEFAQNFANYLYKTHKHSQNSASKNVQILKQFIRDAHENGYHMNTKYQSPKFSIPRVSTSKHFLELNDLKLFEAHTFKKQHLEVTRDLWLIGAYTGLRISDLHRLDYSKHFRYEEDTQVIDIDTFKGRTTKSDTRVVIPVLPQLSRIVKNLDYKIPEAYSDQKMNLYIKEAMELAEIKRKVKHTESKGGKFQENEVPLYKKITSHSARYTFINIMLNDYDVAPHELQKITGQSLKVLMGYERGDKTKNARRVLTKIKKKISS